MTLGKDLIGSLLNVKKSQCFSNSYNAFTSYQNQLVHFFVTRSKPYDRQKTEDKRLTFLQISELHSRNPHH